MAELQDDLERFGRRELTMAQLRRSCLRLAGNDPVRAGRIRAELARARDAGVLRGSEFDALEKALIAVALADSPAARRLAGVSGVDVATDDDGDDDPTVVRPAVADGAAASQDPTVIRGQRQQGAVPAEGGGDDAATVLGAAARAGQPPGGEPDADDDAATVLGAAARAGQPRGSEPDADDDAVTVLGAAARAGQSTQAGPDVDDDAATVLGAAARGGQNPVTPANSDDDTLTPRQAQGTDADRDDATAFMHSSAAAVAAGPDDPTTVPGPRATAIDAGGGEDATRVIGDRGAARPEADDATQVLGAAGTGDDRTTLNPAAAGEVTQADDGADRTRVLGTDEPFDILDPEAMQAAAAALDRDAMREDSEGADTWDPTAPTTLRTVVERTFAAGSVLKERFRLTEPLGEGGMGTVWKAVDILKLEAEDRNPYVAIKLLQGDFKAHPEAFIALQRESSKQQRLAHPNIATVFDFDREAESGTVFMTMEVMNGSDLADYIKSLPEGGLAYDEAMPLIEQLGSGLAYAHKAGLVHSDLKPGNCFLTVDSTVKLLDFGIARASATRDDGESEQTKFDPGQLGALTPSYATVEMFQGLDPDPRDDIYAMAIIAYQLFTGRHPYNRRSAPRAMKEGLTPAYVDKLTKRQNRALADGLAFQRDQRTASVEEFLDGLRPYKRNLGLTVGLPVALAAALVGGLWTPVTDYLDEREREAILEPLRAADVASIETVLQAAAALDDDAQRRRVLADPRTVDAVVQLIAAGDRQSVAEGLALAARLPGEVRDAVKAAAPAQDAIFALHEARMAALFDPPAGRHDFAGALAELDLLREVYPDLGRVFETRDALYARREAAVTDLGVRLRAALADGRLLADAQAEDVGDVLAPLRLMQAGQPSQPLRELLASPAIAAAYAEAARRAIDAQDYTGAERVLAVGLQHAPDSDALAALSSDVLAELKRIRDAERAAALEAELAPLWPTFESLQDFATVRDRMLELAELRADSEVLAAMQGALRERFEAALAARFVAAEVGAAAALLRDYAGLFSFDYLRDSSRRLQAAASAAGADAPVRAAAAEPGAIDQRLQTVERLLDSPEFTATWDSALAVPFKELLALLPGDDTRLQALAARAAQLFAEQARRLTAREAFPAAFAALSRARDYDTEWAGYEAARQQVADAQAAFEAARAEAERLARLEALKASLLERAAANEPQGALEALQALRGQLPADDAFVTEQGPRAIAQAFLRLATAQAAGREFEAALQRVQQGLALAPQQAALVAARDEYLARLRERASEAQASLPPRSTAVGRQPLPLTAVREPDMVAASVPQTADTGVSPRTAAGAGRQAAQAVMVDDITLLAGHGELPSPPVDLAPATPALQAGVAEQVEQALLQRVRADAEAIRALQGPLASHGRLYPERQAAAAERIAEQVESSVLARAAASASDVQPLAALLDAHAQVFGGRHEAFAAAVRQRAGQQMVEVARAAPDDIEAAAAALQRFEAVFGDAPRDALFAPLAGRLLQRGREAGGSAAQLGGAVQAMRSRFPASFAAIEAELAGLLVSALLERSAAAPGQIEPLADDIEGLRALLPARSDALGERLQPALLDGLVRRAATWPGDVDAASPDAAGLAADLQRFTDLFPGAAAQMRSAVSSAMADGLASRARAQGLDASSLQPLVAGYRGLLPDEAAEQTLAAALVPVLTTQIERDLAGDAARVGQIAGPLAALAGLFPDAAESARTRLAAPALEALGSVARDLPLGRLADLTGVLLDQFPQLTGPATARLGPLVAERLVEQARREPATSLAAPLERFSTLLPEAAADIRERVLPVAVDALVATAADGEGTIQALREPVHTLRRLFPAAPALLEARLVPVLGDAMVRAARQAALDPAALAGDVDAYRRLFPDRAAALEARLADALVEALVDAAAVQPFPVQRFSAPLAALGALLPAHRDAADAALAGVLAGAMRGLVEDGSVASLDALREPVTGYRDLLPGQSEVLEQVVAGAALDAMERATRASPGDLQAAAGRTAAFAALFPLQADAARARSAPLVAEAVLAQIRAVGTDLQAGVALVDAFRAVFPARAAQLRGDAAQVLWRAIELQGESQPGQLAPVAGLLREYQRVFAEDYAALSGTLAARTARNIQRSARDTQVSLDQVADMLEQFRALFPARHEAVASEVGGALADRLAGAEVDSRARIEALAPALRVIREQFSGRFEALQTRLGDRAAERVRALEPGDPFAAADLHAAARQVFPDNRALAAISIELPLREVQEGVQLVEQGLLSRAHALLERAVASDPRHSSIPAFRQALQTRQRTALAAYEQYKQVLRTSRRTSDHSRALARARTLWRDNPDFKDLKPPAPYACLASKAGLGARVPCFDQVGQRRTDIGPVMVVVPPGNGIAEPFAISKYEVSVADYNRYCAMSKACQGRRGSRALPMNEISVDEIRAYAAWLSEIAGVVYRLPTDAEWVHAAEAGGQQPPRDFNCTVVVGNQQLKGLSLTSYKSGKENGWGLANYIGNVQELVDAGNGLAARGGSYRDRMQDCSIDLRVEHSGSADEWTGFRLVRPVD